MMDKDYVQTTDAKDPDYGSRLMPNVIDELATSNPARVYATIPLSTEIGDGFRDVTVFELSQSVNHFAAWLEKSIGRSSCFETLAYIGTPDLRYAIVFLAVVKCGYKLLVPSIRNSPWINHSLLEQTKCTRILHSSELSSHVQGLKKDRNDLQSLVVSSFNDLLDQRHDHYPYHASFESNCWDPVLILQSSGSTGPPKPVQTNHATWAVADNDRNLPTVRGRKTQSYALWNFDGEGGRYFAAFPPFHLGGFMALVVLPIYSTAATVVLGPANRPSTGHLASQIMQHYPLRALFCPPVIFEQLVQEPDGLEQAKRLDFILYAGGPLSKRTGDLLSQVTDVCQFYGSTETGAIPALIPQREDWASLEWHPSYAVDMQPSEDDAFELVLHQDPKLRGIRSLSCNFPDVKEYRTRDLFRPQPGKPHLWQFHGRKDDIIVLSNGEKFNPVPSEATISAHAELSAALIVGLGRFQAALLLEPKVDAEEEEERLIEAVWPTIEQANERAPGHGRITRSMIAVSSASKRFERAGKGTVIRGMTEKSFAPEIEALYSRDHIGAPGLRLRETDGLEAIQDYVRASIDYTFKPPSLGTDEDLYVLGLDSLKTLEITGLLKSGLERPKVSWLSAQTIYANPTIRSLALFIYSQLNLESKISETRQVDLGDTRSTKMAALVDKYTQNFPIAGIEKPLLPINGLNIVLTGSTGSLGTYLLLSLLEDPKISKIWCLNRGEDARDRQRDDFRRLGFPHDLDSPDLHFIKVDYGKSDLGLTEAQFEGLKSSVNAIIHNAWKVDFNQTLNSFEPVHIRGVRNLIDWSLSSNRHPHIIFISSISSVSNRDSLQPGEHIVEKPISDHNSAQRMGYAESKNVAESILDVASKKSGVPASILRMGQIGGPVKVAGIWNEDEWVPSMIKTSKTMGSLPSHLPDVDWIPVDILAQIVLEVVHHATESDISDIYNIVNPKPVAWSSLIDTVRQRLDPQIKVVGLKEWIDMLAALNEDDARTIAEKPATRIIDFFRVCETDKSMSALKYDTEHGTSASRTMAQIGPVSTGWMKTWLDQWGY